jgi:hypothetical protein
LCFADNSATTDIAIGLVYKEVSSAIPVTIFRQSCQLLHPLLQFFIDASVVFYVFTDIRSILKMMLI